LKAALQKIRLCSVSDLGPVSDLGSVTDLGPVSDPGSLNDVDQTGAKGVVIGSGVAQERFIVVRSHEAIRCYRNQCPHAGTPLETFPDKFLDESGAFLICSTHGARFEVDTGLCVRGPCLGQHLTPCEISIVENEIFLLKD